MQNNAKNDSHAQVCDERAAASDSGRSLSRVGDLSTVRSQTSSSDVELKPGEGRFIFATPEEEQEYRRFCEEVDRNPERYARYAWEDAG